MNGRDEMDFIHDYSDSGSRLSDRDLKKKKRKVVDDYDDDEYDNEEENKLYCICRSSKTDRFMICCDKCEEWYHGHCVKITESQSKQIRRYYCPICVQKDSTLEFEYTDMFRKIQSSKRKAEDEEEFFSNFECSDDDDDDFEERSNSRKRLKKTISKGATKKTNEKAASAGKKRARSKKTQATKATEAKGRARARKKNVQKKTHEQSSRSKRNRRKTMSDDSGDELKPHIPQHCYGPGCIHSARKGSKYCSDKCGIKLASARILEILPQRLENKQITYYADTLSTKELAKIRQEQSDASNILAELDRKELDLVALIEQGKRCIPYSEEESNQIIEGEDTDYTVHCITCSHEVSIKLAMKHMERCYNKVESRTSFGSVFKTKIEGQNVFCDNYNSAQRTYCKRLRVLCPEHSKEPKVADDEVCGCPLRPDEDPLATQDQYCRILKKKCNRHYNWDKYRQAVIDAQRIQQWLKLDELLEREQKIRKAMSVRHGLIPLLLHKTTPAEPSLSPPPPASQSPPIG